MTKKGIVFDIDLQKNIVDFDLCKYEIDEVALSIDNTIYYNSPTNITTNVIFTVLKVADSFDLIQKIELLNQNCYYLRNYNGYSNTFSNWASPQGTGSADGGALNLKVESEDNTIIQNGSSTYDGAMREITVNLKAVFNQIQSNWTQTDSSKSDFIKNKPTIPAAQIQSDYTQSSTAALDFIKNKPTFNNSPVFSSKSYKDITTSAGFFAGMAQIAGTNLQYDALTGKLNATDTGMVNPMTAQYDLILGGLAGVPTRLQKGLANQVLTVNAALSVLWADNPALYQYSKYRYIDNVNGVDTNIGSYNSPYKTMAYAINNNSTGMIFVLMGQSTETAFTIPAAKTNIDIVAFGTRLALNGFTQAVSVAGTGAGSVRFQDINFGAGLTRVSASNCGIYLYNGSIGTNGFTQAGNGYTEFNDVDASNANNTITAGTFTVNAGKLIAPIVSGTGTFVKINNAGAIIGNCTVAIGSRFSCILSIWIAATTGFALTAVANTIVLLDGVQFVRPDLGTLAPISLAGSYSVQYMEFDKENSSLSSGTNLATTDWFDRIGLLNVSTVTGMTYVLVIDANGRIAKQLIASPSASLYQINTPISGVYCDSAVDSNVVIKNSAATTQITQKGLTCNSNGAMTLNKLVSYDIPSGKTVEIKGDITFYNINAITQTNYYVNIQVIGMTSGGQLVNLGTQTQTILAKDAYKQQKASFSGTQLLVTNLISVGIQAQVIYAEKDNTALINTLYATVSVS